MNVYRIWRIHRDGGVTHVCDREGMDPQGALEARMRDSTFTGKFAVAMISGASAHGEFAIFEVVGEPTLRRVVL